MDVERLIVLRDHYASKLRPVTSSDLAALIDAVLSPEIVSTFPPRNTFTARAPKVLAPMVVCDPPKPIDASGSMSNDELREIAKKKVPPQTWFDGDEEQVF